MPKRPRPPSSQPCLQDCGHCQIIIKFKRTVPARLDAKASALVEARLDFLKIKKIKN
jgi:hypothetical protein